jgi:hypothetical protein
MTSPPTAYIHTFCLLRYGEPRREHLGYKWTSNGVTNHSVQVMKVHSTADTSLECRNIMHDQGSVKL